MPSPNHSALREGGHQPASPEPRPLPLRVKVALGAVATVVAVAWGGEVAHQTIQAHGCEVKPDRNPAHVFTAPFADTLGRIIYTDKDARQCP